jgi:hypothetical protein
MGSNPASFPFFPAVVCLELHTTHSCFMQIPFLIDKCKDVFFFILNDV